MGTGKDLQPFVNPPCWEISPADLTRFFRELSAFAPAGSVLCLEGGDAPDVEDYLEGRPTAIKNQTNPGFLKMRPKIFFMPITSENVRDLADLTEVHAEPEVCSNLQVYDDEKIILSWHDLPFDSLFVVSTIDEAAVRKFSEALGCEYVFLAAG